MPVSCHVYDVLPRLAERGLARRRVVPQVGKPDKHLWRLTPRGRAALRRWINTPEPDPLGNLSVLLLKVFFGDYGDPAALVALLERFRDQLSARLTALRRIDAEAVFAAPQALPRMTLRLGLAEMEAHLGWAEANLAELRARPRTRARREHSRASFPLEPREHPFRDFGAHVTVLRPGEPNALYHSEGVQEGFLVLSGRCTPDDRSTT